MIERNGIVIFQNVRDPDNEVTFFREKNGTVTLSAAEEKAVGSYNETFECRYTFSLEEVSQLRKWLEGTQ